ncbi:MAG: hypothetical protein K0S97_2626 [Chloroflexota bacterium]|nr:hypothetical protein [Chloroflexota bacterium]
MGEAKYGSEFITHEFDEAIAIQQAIVDGAETLSTAHSRPDSKRLIKRVLREDTKFLSELRRLGRKHDATGKLEGVALALKELMDETAQSAAEAPSESYEAHAVLINLKRKQQDSAAAMLKIAREQKDTDLRTAATEFGKATKASAQELANDLATFAVEIATMRRGGASAGV